MSEDLQPYLSPEYQARALAEFLAKHVKPYDPATDDYERPPFAEDIKEGKNDPIYNAHSYHTKVPPRSIIPYILHYTQPGDVVLDPFCGSGMTGVAAQMCANPPEDLLAQFPDLKDRVGPRACILNDLSPAACHIAYNYNPPVDVDALRREFERIKAAVKDEFAWLYGTEHYEPAVGLYSPKSPDLIARLKNPPAGAVTARLLDDSVERTWELLTRAEVESRLGYPVTELPTLARRASEGGSEQAGAEQKESNSLASSNPASEPDGSTPDPSLARRASVSPHLAEVDEWVCIPATIQYTIWSDVYRCEGLITVEEPTGKISARGKNAGKPMVRRKRVPRGCGENITLWDVAVDHEAANVSEDFACRNCEQEWKKVQLKRSGTVPILTNYIFVGLRERRSGQNRRVELTTIQTERMTSATEIERIREIDAQTIQWFIPDKKVNTKGPQYTRNALSARGITNLADFYSRRNLRALARLWQEASRSDEERPVLLFALTGTFGHIERMTRYKFKKGGNSALTGQLYFPSFPVEDNVLRQLESKVKQIDRAWKLLWPQRGHRNEAIVRSGHAGALTGIPDSAIDYVFADPPFGSNIYYNEVNWLYESWLGRLTYEPNEAVVHRKNDRGTKTIDDYSQLMAEAFRELYRVLKPSRWATIEFNNNDGRIFEAIKQAIRDAGFEIVNMLLLDKEHKTFKQIKGAEGVEDVVDKDVLFNLHKPAVVRAESQQINHDLEHQVSDAVRQHLLSLPARIQSEPSKYNDEHRTTATINSMLMNSLIPRGVSVEQLNLPVIERVCSRYFRKIGQRWYLRGEAISGNGNDGLFEEEIAVKDDLSAIDWLRQKVRARPMLIGELKPLWMRAVGLLPADVSQSLSLDELLTENFWRDEDTNRWREPTDDERERMNDDRSIRVLHDAERYLAETLRRSTTDAERCDWIDVLFKACRQVEEGDTQSAPTLRDFDLGEGYRLITRLFQSVLGDDVPKDVFAKAQKQSGVASSRVSGAVRQEEQEIKAEKRKKHPTLFD